VAPRLVTVQGRQGLSCALFLLQQAIDVAFLDRADIKAYIGLPSEAARYEMLRSALEELIRCGMIAGTSCPEAQLPEASLQQHLAQCGRPLVLCVTCTLPVHCSLGALGAGCLVPPTSMCYCSMMQEPALAGLHFLFLPWCWLLAGCCGTHGRKEVLRFAGVPLYL
jgi:hypothetical protein